MARNSNETSVRQQAFTYLDNNPNVGRKEAAEAMMAEFGIGKAYAMTIFQQHRNDMKESGKLTTVYSVKETDEGPSVVTSHVLKASKSDATDPKSAVDNYVAGLKARIESATKIDTKAIAKAEEDAKAAVEAVKAEKVAAALARKQAAEDKKAAAAAKKAEKSAESKTDKPTSKKSTAKSTKTEEAPAESTGDTDGAASA